MCIRDRKKDVLAIATDSDFAMLTGKMEDIEALRKQGEMCIRDSSGALLQKELRRFVGSTNYMLNCGLGIVLMPFSAAALVLKRCV